MSDFELHTITILRRQIQPDLFGAELALGVLSLAINDMLKMTKCKKFKFVTVNEWSKCRYKIIASELRKQLSIEYAKAYQVYLWMHEPNGRFEFWCNHLGFVPEYVRELIKKELEHNATKRNRRAKSYIDACG